MRASDLFTKTFREQPADEESINAILLVKAGYVQKLMAGVYTFLPLGLRVLKHIEGIIREEMNAIGGQELLMPALHPIENYQVTKRDGIDVLFHTELIGGRRLVLGQSHEEIIVPVVQKFLRSYKDLPFAVYQIQTKFRNELRAKSGILRGKEFIMKDLYSFHISEDDFSSYYKIIQGAYQKIFNRTGLGECTYLTYASGGTFSEFSHEFQTLTKAGEDIIFICRDCNTAINREIKDTILICPQCNGERFSEEKSVEIGNIFPLKTRFSDAFGLRVKNEAGENIPIIMGCYGIGLTRLMGTIAEVWHDERGLLWPQGVSPFSVHLIALNGAYDEGEKIYETLQKKSVAVFYDDREFATAGEKFSDADLMGMPLRAVVSPKTLIDHRVELKDRKTGAIQQKPIAQFIEDIC